MTRIEVARAPGRVRCVAVGDVLSPRVLLTDDDGARVALVAAGALLLGGDEVTIDVVVGAGARLEVVETAGTVAYRGPTASWTVRVRLETGARLLWEGLPFVVAQGADVRRATVLALDDGARAVLRETLVLGRSGELGGRVRQRTHVTQGRRDLLVEDIDLAPSLREAPGVLGTGAPRSAARVLDVVAAYGFRPDGAASPGLERAAQAPARARLPAGVTHRFDLAGPGAVVRHLGMHAHATPLDGLVDRWARQVPVRW